MNEPKFSFPNELLEKDDDKDWDVGAHSKAKKEPQMNWDKSPVDITAFLKKEPSTAAVEHKTVESKEDNAPVTMEKEKHLLEELLKEKDKTIAAKDEVIELQRKLIEQLLKDR